MDTQDEYIQKLEERIAKLEQGIGTVENNLKEGTRVVILDVATLKENDLFDHVCNENEIEELIENAVMKAEGIVGKVCDWDEDYTDILFRVWIPIKVKVSVNNTEVRVVE